jgi:hypothetical protein
VNPGDRCPHRRSDPRGARFDASEFTGLTLVTELCSMRNSSDNTFMAVETIFGVAATTLLLMIVSLSFGLARVLNAADLDIDKIATAV